MNTLTKKQLALIILLVANTASGAALWQAARQASSSIYHAAKRGLAGERKFDVYLEKTLKGKEKSPDEQKADYESGTYNFSSYQYQTYEDFSKKSPEEQYQAFIEAFKDLIQKMQREPGIIIAGPDEETLTREIKRADFLLKEADNDQLTVKLPAAIKSQYATMANRLQTEIENITAQFKSRIDAAELGKQLYTSIFADTYTMPPTPTLHQSNMLTIANYLFAWAQQNRIPFTQGTFKVLDPLQQLYNALIQPPANQCYSTHGRLIDKEGNQKPDITFFCLAIDMPHRLPHNMHALLIWHDEYGYTFIKPESSSQADISGFFGAISGTLSKPLETASSVTKGIASWWSKESIESMIQEIKAHPALGLCTPARDETEEYRKDRVPSCVIKAWIACALNVMHMDEKAITIAAQRGIWDMALATYDWYKNIQQEKPLTPEAIKSLATFIHEVERAIAPQQLEDFMHRKIPVYGRMGREVDGPIADQLRKPYRNTVLRHAVWDTLLQAIENESLKTQEELLKRKPLTPTPAGAAAAPIPVPTTAGKSTAGESQTYLDAMIAETERIAAEAQAAEQALEEAARKKTADEATKKKAAEEAAARREFIRGL